MLRLRMSVEDIARTRLAAPGLCELPVSMQALQLVGHPYRRMWRSATGRLPRQAGRLWELVPARGDVPLFLAPEMVDDLEEAIDIVQSTPAARIRAEVTVGRGTRPSAWVEDLCRGRTQARHELGVAMRAYHDRVMAPLSSVHTRVVTAELSHRTRQIAAEGIATMLNSLHPAIRWRAGVLEVAGPMNADVDLSGRGLRVMPSVWPRPGVALDWSQPTLVYPIPYAIWLAETNAGYDGARAALGGTRATVLQTLVDEHTTTSLARAVALSPSSASAHASALRRAGLVVSQRRGKAMVHSLTPLGLDVVTASRGGDVPG
ncbi:ArsR family transcriptional regulator [Jiangella aurantiaca]|uniref:ArsR family transcriptional regulator n=1 Tax=Jiangella aurantiaca TaxID=2530373 RepID=A0A4R5A8F9_9ACTN|nr:ArsR family transcriptional regulator [Jiangella aurantiaca]TDD68443.1 ArsR family transcriptional regulator [Jiangella aurantiaca]